MANKNGIATIREDKFNKGLIQKLHDMAIADGGRSLNNYLLNILASHIRVSHLIQWANSKPPTSQQIQEYKNKINNEQKNAGPANGRPNDSESSEV